MLFLGNVSPCILGQIYSRFGVLSCLHLQGRTSSLRIVWLHNQVICRQLAWSLQTSWATISYSRRFRPTHFVIHSSGHVSYIQAPFLHSCGKGSRVWTSPSIALLYLHDRVRHCQTTVTARSVRTTCSSENIHIYRPDVALCRSELNSATVFLTPVRWKCSENNKYFLLVVTPSSMGSPNG
jgi:hypothetical protein